MRRSLPHLFALVLLALSWGCSSDEEIVDPNKLCKTGAGFGARITGTPQPIDMCVSNDSTATTLGVAQPNRYELAASLTADGITIHIDVSFMVHQRLPEELNVTSNQAQAFGDPNGAWFFYREVDPGAYDYVSTSVTGTFTLTFSDPTVAVATFSDLVIELEDAGGTPAGMRVISEGFLSVSPDN